MTPSQFLLRKRLRESLCFLLRWETPFTPCTGITAVTKQERRHFLQGVMIAPWHSCLKRKTVDCDPIKNGSVIETGWSINVCGTPSRVLASTDENAPCMFLDIPGRFRGHESPYDTSLSNLRMDTLYFGQAVSEFLKFIGASKQQWIWGADWECCPSLALVRSQHHVALTIHNCYDECLDSVATAFGSRFDMFRGSSSIHQGLKTALQVGIECCDVVTTVNRGYLDGLRNEQIHELTAGHLRPLLRKVVGINNGPFAPLSPELVEISELLRSRPMSDVETGRKQLFARKLASLERLPDKVKKNAAGKVLVVAMGRRVAQKGHVILVESLREILTKDPEFPILVVFATVHGDSNSPAILGQIKALADEFCDNVVCEDGQLAYFMELMAAADYSCMPSLYEPHGGAFDGTILPIARAVDGLAEQTCGRTPHRAAQAFNDKWHLGEEPCGFLFREDPFVSSSPAEQLELLLNSNPYSSAFNAIRASLSVVLREAVDLRLSDQDEYARMVSAALRKQETQSWQANFDAMFELIALARKTRILE